MAKNPPNTTNFSVFLPIETHTNAIIKCKKIRFFRMALQKISHAIARGDLLVSIESDEYVSIYDKTGKKIC